MFQCFIKYLISTVTIVTLRTTLYQIKTCNKIALKCVYFRRYQNSWNLSCSTSNKSNLMFIVTYYIIVVCESIHYVFLYNIHILYVMKKIFIFYFFHLILSCVIAVIDLLQQLYAVPRTCSFDSHLTVSCCSRKHTGGNPIWDWTQKQNYSIIFLKRNQIYYLLFVFVQ